MFDIVSVGHFSIDSIFLPSRQSAFTVLGGSVAYASFAARRLDARVSVISKVGIDFPAAYKWWLQQEGVDLSGLTTVNNELTTRFELRYSEDLSKRILSSTNRVSPFDIEQLPNSLKATIVHLAPIAREVNYDIAVKLRPCAEIMSLEIQGLIRSFDENGNVTLEQPTDKSIFKLVDIVKSTPAEIMTLTGASDIDSAVTIMHDFGVAIVIVTLGADGAIVSVEGASHKVPAYQPEKVVDPTGAGDAFIGAFLAEYAHGEDCAWCSNAGAAAASLVVEGIGPTFFGDKEEICRRARSLSQKQEENSQGLT